MSEILIRRYCYAGHQVVDGRVRNSYLFEIETELMDDGDQIHSVYMLGEPQKDGSQAADDEPVGVYRDSEIGFNSLGVAIRAGREGHDAAMAFAAEYQPKEPDSCGDETPES